MISVLVITEVRFFRDGLTGFIDRQTAMQVVGSAASLAEGAALAGGVRADVALVDVQMAEGPTAVGAVLAAAPKTHVVALAVRDDEHDLMACVECGAAGYVPQDASLDDVVRAIEAVARGETLCSPRAASLLFRRVAALASRAAPLPATGSLTSREREVVELLSRGLSNKEIARRLYIEVPTVKNHVHNILEKLDVRRRGEVVTRLGPRGIADPDPRHHRSGSPALLP